MRKKARDGFGAVNVPIGKVSRAFLLMKAKNTSHPGPNCVARASRQLVGV